MKKVVNAYLGFQFFFQLLIWLPIFYEYQVRIGLSPEQIFHIQSLYYIAFCVLEIPTGLIADRLGYLRCLRAGAVVLVAANFLPIVAQSYAGFLTHFLLIALSRSLISGASSAYIYDYLATRGETALYKDVEGKARSYGLVGKVIGWAGVGVLMKWEFTLPYSITTASSIISVFFAIALPAIPRESVAAPARALHRHIGEALRIVASKPALFLIMLQGVGLFVLGRIVQVNLFQPIVMSKSFDLSALGWTMSLMTVFEAIGSYSPGLLRRYAHDLNAVHLLTLGMAAALAFIPLTGQWGVLGALAVFSTIVGISFPIQKQLINDAIEGSSFRATILSLESIVDRAVCAWVAALLGKLMADPAGLNQFLYYSAGVTVIGVVLLYGLFHLAPLPKNEARA